METPHEAEGHKEMANRKETQAIGTSPVDPPTERIHEGEKLRDANQPSDIPFSKSPVDEAY